jgi:hypothetical protein
MIVKYFHRNIWHIGENWENTSHVFRVPDSGIEVEQKERDIVVSLGISDDKQSQRAEEEDGESLSLLRHRYAYDI